MYSNEDPLYSHHGRFVLTLAPSLDLEEPVSTLMPGGRRAPPRPAQRLIPTARFPAIHSEVRGPCRGSRPSIKVGLVQVVPSDIPTVQSAVGARADPTIPFVDAKFIDKHSNYRSAVMTAALCRVRGAAGQGRAGLGIVRVEGVKVDQTQTPGRVYIPSTA